MNPIDRNMIATIPAMMPGPKMATNNSAQMIVLTDRDDTRMNRPIHRVTTLGVVLRAAI